MFEVGFQELALIFGVALMVLGPARLSSLVSKVGRWVGKARSMARDFRQQLESEVNLEELNKMTELQTRQARGGITPAPPPELSGVPMPDSNAMTYPYSAPPEAAPPAVASATDDTYSHAHAEGDSPLPYVEETPSAVQEPAQANLDLSPPPDDYSDLPPDDARRYS